MRLILRAKDNKTVDERISEFEKHLEEKFKDQHLKHRKNIDYVLGALVVIDLIIGILK